MGTRSPSICHVFMHIQTPLSIPLTDRFLFNLLRHTLVEGIRILELAKSKITGRSPVVLEGGGAHFVPGCVHREGGEGEGWMPSSLLITILCDSLSWFVTVAPFKRAILLVGWTRMALAWARQRATRTKRRGKKDRFFNGPRKLVISWNEIFFSRVSFVAICHALPAIHRWIGNFEASSHP